jgi:hypothetical protein
MRIHRSVVGIARAALSACAPLLFLIARTVGGLPPVKPPQNPWKTNTKIRENPCKIPHRQPSSTLKTLWGAPGAFRPGLPADFFLAT